MNQKRGFNAILMGAAAVFLGLSVAAQGGEKYRTQAPMFKKGNFYVQIHSEKAPAGNLWGWLVLEPRK